VLYKQTQQVHVVIKKTHKVGAFSLWKGLDVKQLDKEKTCRAWKELPQSISPGPTEVGDKKRTVGPGRNYFHQSFLALHVGDKKRTRRAWKELPQSVLPGPSG
jgi:hypothetical protein